jgi:nitrite reductase/ring-hydroxylating ferredoxin subunit
MSKHDIGHIGEFPEGKGTRINVRGIQIAVFNIEGELYAIQDNCTHKNLPLSLAGKERYRSKNIETENGDSQLLGNVDGEKLTVHCPWHRLEWELDTGYCPVRNEHIPTYQIEIEEEQVYVEI